MLNKMASFLAYIFLKFKVLVHLTNNQARHTSIIHRQKYSRQGNISLKIKIFQNSIYLPYIRKISFISIVR
jgi:hypothetical protein